LATADHNSVGNGTDTSGIANGAGGNIEGVRDAHLGPLQDNGGPTQTMALLAGSLATGQADNSKGPATDQRGVMRLDTPGEVTDIGVYELSATSPSL
jgi:hypothetical protein